MTGGIVRMVGAAAEVAAAARSRGASVGLVGAVGGRQALLAAVGAALGFPAWYGHNLDALHDCLTDLSWLPAGEVVLVWDGDDALRRADPAGHDAVLEVLADAACATSAGPRPLRVVLTGDAPPPADLRR